MTQDRRALDPHDLLILDGATGTMLAERAADHRLKASSAPDVILLEAPDLVRAVHGEYVDAGANALLTCTFSSSRHQLEKRGLAPRLAIIHQRAAEIARAAAGDHCFVFGDLGPCGRFFPPMGSLTTQDASASYAERTRALIETGCIDALLIETQYDLREALCAVQGVRSVTDLPLAVSMSFDSRGRTMMGISPETFAEQMQDLPVDWIGANCGATVEETIVALESLRAACPDRPLWAKPNAGRPTVLHGVTRYPEDPPSFARYAPRFLETGVRAIGGCCGTTPAHITALAEAVHAVDSSEAER